MQACDRCHRRKSRCGKEQPRCADCLKAGVECVYSDRSREPTFRREHVEAIERKLKRAEARNRALSSELAKARPASPSISGVHTGSEVHGADSSPSVDLRHDAETTRRGRPSGALPGDIMSEVSFLASTAAGDRHYLGSTSGVLFASLVRASVDVASSNQPTTQFMREGASSNTIEGYQKSFDAGVAIEALPPEQLARKLVQSYLVHDHLCYPFLLPSFILSVTDLVYSDPTFYGRNAFDSFVFDMVLAIANANVYKFDWQMLPSAESHHARAMLRINEVFQAGGLKSLQAILLLCQYRTSSSIQDTSASMWHLVGIAVRTVYELGLHRESVYPVKDQSSIDPSTINAMTSQEIRRRCFWCVFAMDRVVSITLGRPLAMNMDDVDVSLPSLEDDHLVNSGLLDAPDSEDLNRTAIFVHIIEYRLLCGKTMRSLHGLKREDYNEANATALRDSLAVELDKWKLRTRDLALPDVDMSLPMSQERSSFRSKEWYEVLYSNGMLMLFRPSPMLSDISKDSATLQKIFNSAKQAVTLYAYLHKSRKINYSWITLHSVFMAGLSYIYAVSRHFRERRRSPPTGALLESDPSTIEIVNDTRACSNVLVAVSERWNALRHCHEVFDKLSDAVLADAIKLHSPPRQINQQPATTMPTPSRQDDFPGHIQVQTSQGYGSGTPWYGNEGPMGMTPGFYTQTSPLAVDSEFRNCFGDLQHLYNQPFSDDPVMQLSQDWLGYLDGFDGLIPLAPQAEYQNRNLS